MNGLQAIEMKGSRISLIKVIQRFLSQYTDAGTSMIPHHIILLPQQLGNTSGAICVGHLCPNQNGVRGNLKGIR